MITRWINLHSHTIYSDGSNSILEMATTAKNNNHVCLCITDHDYMITLNDFERQLIEAKEVSDKLDFPIIVGLEINVGAEEFLLFNQTVIKQYFNLKPNLNFSNDKRYSFERLKYLFLDCKNKGEEFSLVMCHPSLRGQPCSHFQDIYDWFVDGYEMWNSGYFFFNKRKIPKFLWNKKAFINLDAHSTDDIIKGRIGKGGETNEHQGYIIKNEQDLVKWIKQKEPSYEDISNI